MVAPNMHLPITQATASDIDEIMRIELACFSPGIREAREVFLDRLTTFPDGNLVLLAGAERGRACAGYLSSEIWNEVPACLHEAWGLGHSAKERHRADGEVLYISSFALDPAFRGKGAGRFFFQESIDRICWANPRVKRIAFIVNESWLAARRIYETEGFAYTGKLEGFFAPEASNGKRTDALVMERNL
jgi:ribosomal-protein-alanine N-acetyltransferase